MNVAHDALSSRDFERISRFILKETGIRLTEHKHEMVQARVAKRVASLEMASFAEYADFVFGERGGGFEKPKLIDAITTNKTDFFREADHFEILTQQVLPQLVAEDSGLGRSRPFRVWCAACSSGEEPYSLAMVLADYAFGGGRFEFAIYGTDICQAALKTAKKAVYDAGRVVPVPEALKRRYLLRSRDESKHLVRVNADIRRRVRFSRLNLVRDLAPFTEPADVVFCRNVLIYFSRDVQLEVLDRLDRAMRPGSYLFVGHSEGLQGFDRPYERVGPAVYRKLR